MFTGLEKTFLLSLARRAIEHYLTTGRVLTIDRDEAMPRLYKEKRACFVTLTILGHLRGCIGHLVPVQELSKDVIDNAVSAAFHDPRFLPLTAFEFPNIKIEISVLTIPEPLAFSSPDELLKKLRPGQDGVLIKKGPYQATFLPQVWDDLPEPAEFLSHLCLKAGLGSFCWQEPGLQVEVYEVEKWGEF